jgi:hypothetical protein
MKARFAAALIVVSIGRKHGDTSSARSGKPMATISPRAAATTRSSARCCTRWTSRRSASSCATANAASWTRFAGLPLMCGAKSKILLTVDRGPAHVTKKTKTFRRRSRWQAAAFLREKLFRTMISHCVKYSSSPRNEGVRQVLHQSKEHRQPGKSIGDFRSSARFGLGPCWQRTAFGTGVIRHWPRCGRSCVST